MKLLSVSDCCCLFKSFAKGKWCDGVWAVTVWHVNKRGYDSDLSAFLSEHLCIFHTVYLEYGFKDMLWSSLHYASPYSYVKSANAGTLSNSAPLLEQSATNVRNDVKISQVWNLYIFVAGHQTVVGVVQSSFEAYQSHVETFIQNNGFIQVYPEAFGNSPANSSHYQQKWYLCSVVTNAGNDSETLQPIVLFEKLLISLTTWVLNYTTFEVNLGTWWNSEWKFKVSTERKVI